MPEETDPQPQATPDRKRPHPEPQDRASRLAAALRENLARRKAQARARADARDGED